MNHHQQAPTHRGVRRSGTSGTLDAVVPSANDAELVVAAQTGDRQAFSTLFERWFDRSYDVAWRIVRNRDTAAEVAQDTFLTAWTKLDTLRDPEAFGGWVLRSSRNKALNRLEREGRSMAFDTDDTVGMIDRKRSALDVADDIVRQEQADLVWAAAAALGERDASILDLHLRHDLGAAEIAEALDIAPNAAHQTLFRLRKRLEGAIRSYVLWHDGQPECGVLAEVLDSGSIEAFGPRAVKAISTHVASCEDCDRRHADILAPASMFAAVPFLVVGAGIRKAAAAELASQGVPIDPSLISSTSAAADQAATMTAIALAESGGNPPGAGATGEDSRGLWQINAGSHRRKVVVGALAAAFILVAAVAGAGLLDDGGTTEVETIAAPGTIDSQQRGLGSIPASSTTELADPDAPPSSTEPPVVDPTTSTTATTAPPRTTVPPVDPSTTTTTATVPPRDTTTSTTATTAPADPPTFTMVRVVYLDVDDCGGVSGRRYEVLWDTADATSVVVNGPGVAPGNGAPRGSVQPCIGFDESPSWQLTANGPGGTTQATAAAAR